MMTGFTPISPRKASRRLSIADLEDTRNRHREERSDAAIQEPLSARRSPGLLPPGSQSPGVAMTAGSLIIILDVGEPLVAGRGSFERFLLAGTPGDELLNSASELEVLVGDPLGGVGLQL